MKTTTLILFLLSAVSSIGQISRVYFFDENLPINDSTSLLVIAENPQTQFAKNLNARIYSDTNFLKKIKESWYVEESNAGKGRTYHRCGHDLYFYKLSGDEFTLIKKLNSQCKEFDIGMADIEVLREYGKPLHIDTLTRLRINAYRDDIFTEDLIESYYINGKGQNWEITKSTRYPKIYYEGYFKTTIPLDSSLSIAENIERFIL